MDHMVFVTGFARGGTSWLRDCIGSHPDVAVLPRECVVFRDMQDPEQIRQYFVEETKELPADAPLIVNKAPANAPHIGFAARAFPESKFIFIIRDPRDVLVSHQRGTQKWMGGANSTVDGCMKKIETYFKGWLEAKDLPNVCLVRYEDLHQNFFEAMRRIFAFIGVETTNETLRQIFEKNNFQAQTKRSNVEDRAAAKRKGVIGEWATHLTDKEQAWYKRSPFFVDFFEQQGYGWTLHTYENILKAMCAAKVHFLSEEDLLNRRLVTDRPNVVVQHDIDYLTNDWCSESVRRTALLDRSYKVSAAYNFLPSDDKRYSPNGLQKVIELVKFVRTNAADCYIGLHVNAFERYYPPSADEVVGDDFPHREEVSAYIDKMICTYLDAGINFRIATAYGYGRGSKLPNNQDTSLIPDKLMEYGIQLFDTAIRPTLALKAGSRAAVSDVGGVLKPRYFNNGFDLTDPKAYNSLPPGTFFRFLTHPGNYPVDKPATIIMRHFRS